MRPLARFLRDETGKTFFVRLRNGFLVGPPDTLMCFTDLGAEYCFRILTASKPLPTRRVMMPRGVNSPRLQIPEVSERQSWSYDPTVDGTTIAQCTKVLSRLRQQLHHVEDDQRQHLIQADIDFIETYLRTNIRSGPRNADTELRNANAKIHMAIGRFRKKLNAEFPELAQHLKKYVKSESSSWFYDKPQPPEIIWDFQGPFKHR